MKTLFNIGDKITAGDIASYIFDTIRPVAGYSLRKLSNISGPVIRARRGIDNKESDFYADEIEGGELQSFATGDGASNVFVTTWYDQFGNNNATQTTAADQPKIWDASIGLVTENEKPAIEFDGVDDFLTSQQIVLIDDITMIAIASQKSYNIGFVFGQGNGFTSVDSTQQQATIGFSTSTIQFELKPDNFNEISGGISYIPNDRYLIIGNYSRGNHFYFYTNGLISNFIDNVPDSPIENYQTPLAIGRSVSRNNFTLDGTIQELFLYTNNQINNIALLQNNLNQYYIIFGPLRYNQRITEDSGTFALTDRYEAVYDEVTEIATPSLLCTCDAYKESTLTTYGKLYNIIPA